MGLIDQHIIQLEAALAVLHSNHDHAAHDKAQQDFAKQLGVGLASRLQEAAFRPSDVSRILAAVDSTLAGDDLLGHYTKALQVLSISAAETAVRDALEALQLSKDATVSSDRSSRQQDDLHNTSATDAQQQGLDLCTRLLKQLQEHLADYKETGKQLTAIGEQLGKASEGLAGLNEQLQAPSASIQAETLSKACQDLDEVLMSLAELQLAYEGSTQYTHNTNKTLKALKGLQKQYATASQGGCLRGAGGRLNHVIEAQQAWNSAAAALQKDTSDISAATANLSSIHNSLETLLQDLEPETDNTSAAEVVHLIKHSDAELQQLNLQQQQQLTACTDVREQLNHLFDVVRSSSSSGGGSAASAGTSPSPAANAAADGSLSSSCSPSHAAAHHPDPAGATCVAGAAHSSHSLCDMDQSRSVNSSNSNTTGGGHHVPALAAAAAMSSSSPNRRCSRLGLASKAASVHNEYEEAQAAAEAAADPADATRAVGLAAAAVAATAQQPAAGVDKPLRWHENVLSLVEDDAQPSEPHVQQQQQPEQQPQEPQQQQQQRDLPSNALQQLRELQASLAAAMTRGQPLAGDELLQMCESLQQLVQQAPQETLQHQAALPALQLTARLTSVDMGLDYNTVGPQMVDTASMYKWANPVFRRESYPGLFDAEAVTPDSSSGGAYCKLRRMSEAQIEGVYIASVTAAADAGQDCGLSSSGSGPQQRKQPQQQLGLDIAVHDQCSADAEESTTPRTRSDMPDPPSRLHCLDKPPSSRDMDAAAAAAALEVDIPNPKQDSGADAASCQQAAAGQVGTDPDTAAAVAVSELLAATQEVSNRLGPHGLADLVEAAAAIEGLSDVAILMSLITRVVQHQQGVAALTARLQQQQQQPPNQGSYASPTAADKLAKGTTAGSTPTSTIAAATWTIPAVYDGQQRQGQIGTLSTGDSMLGILGRVSSETEEQCSPAAAAALESSDHVSRQLTRSSTLGLPTTMEGSAVALADEDSSSLLHTTSDVCCGAAAFALESQSGADAAIHQQQELAADVASQPLGDHSCWVNKSSSSSTAEGEQSGPTRCCSDSSILAGASGRSLSRSDSYLTNLNKMLQAESRQLQQQVELLQQQLAKAQAEAASLREKLRHQQQERQQQEQQIADHQQQVAELLEQLDAVQAAAAAAKDQHAAELQQQLSAAAVEADEMQRQHEQLQEQLGQLKLIEQLRQQFADAQLEIASLTKQQHDRQQEVDGLLLQHQQQLQALQQQLVRANEQVAFFTEQQASLSALRDENQQLQQQNSVLQQQLSAGKPESEQLQRAEGEPDPTAAGSGQVGELSAPVKCSSPGKKGRLPLFRRATTDAVTASCPTFALGPAAGAAAGLSGSPNGSLQGAAKRAVQGNNDNSSNLHGSLEGTPMQALPPTSGDLKEGGPKRRVTWDVNPSSAAAAAAAASAQKALRAFLGAIKGAGSGKKQLVGRVMVDGTVSIQPEDSAAVSSPVGRSEPSTSGKPAPVVGLIELEDGPEKQQHLQQQQQQQHWRQQQLQMQRLLADQPPGISDAEEWDVQHSALSLTCQHRSVSEIGVQLGDLDHPAAAAAAEADIPAGDDIDRTGAMGASVPTMDRPVGAGASDSTLRLAADSNGSEDAGSSSSVTFTQLQAALAFTCQQLGHKEQQLLDFQDWVELLRLGLARVRQALDSNDGRTDGKDSAQHTPLPQCRDVAVVGSSSTDNSSANVCRPAAAAALEAVTESTPAAAAVANWSEATGEQLVLLHELQSIADEVKVVCCERHLLQNALQEQLRAISRLEQSLQAAKEQQGLQQAALLQLEEDQIAAANAAAEQLAAAQRAIEQQKQEQMAAAATAAEKIAQLEQQEQQHCAAAAEAQHALLLLTQQQQEQGQQWHLREQEYQAAAAAATQRLLELQQQQREHEAAAAEAMQKLAEVVNQQQHKEAEWQQQEQQHLAAAKAAAELIAELQQQEQDQRVTAAEALQNLAALVEQQAALEQDWQQKQEQQQAIAAEAAQKLADMQDREQEHKAAAAAVAEQLAAALDQQQQLQQEQRQAADEAAATIADLERRLEVAEQDQQAAAAAADAQIAELQSQLHVAQQEGQSLQEKGNELQAQLGTAQEAAQQQREAAAAQQQQEAAAAEAASIIADLRSQLQAAEQKQVTTAAEAAAAIGQLESRLELARAAEQEQQAAAAQASAAAAALQEQLQAAQAAAQEVPGLEEQLSTLRADLEAAEARTTEERTAVAAEAAATLAELQSQLHAAQAAEQEQQAAAAESAAQVADLQSQMQAAQTAAQQVPLLKQEISTLHAQLEAAYAQTEEVAAKAFAAVQQGSAAAAAADESKASAEQAAAAQVAAEAAAQTARHELAQLQQQYAETSSQKAELTSKLAAVQQQSRNAEQQVSDLQQQLHELTSLHDVLMQQLQRVDQSTAGPLDAAKIPESAAAAGVDLQIDSKPFMSKLDQVKHITEQLQQLWSAHSRAQELTVQLAAAEQALQQQKNTVFAAHARAADLQHRLAAAELSSESLAATQQAEQARQQQAAAAEVQGLQQQITDLRSELTAADQARQQQEHAAAAAETEAQSLNQQISGLTAEVQQLQSEQLRQQQQQAAAAAAGVEAQGLKQLAALQSECDGLRQQMQAMFESCADRDREIQAQQQQLAHLQAELANLSELNQQLVAATAAASSQVATIDATVQTEDTTNSSSSNAGPVDQQILTSWGSMTLRNSLRGSREGSLRSPSRDGGLRTSRDGTEQQQQDAFTLMRDLSARERELAELKAVLQGREATLADTNQELMLVQQSMSELQDQLAELQAELHIVRTEAAVKVAAANNKAFASQQAARQSQEVASAAALHSSKADSSMVQQLQHQLRMLQGQLAAEQEGRLREAAALATALKQAGAETANAQAAASEEIMQLQAELGHNMQLVQQQADQLQQQAEQLQQHEQQRQQHEEELQSSRDEIQQLQQQLSERVKQLQQQQGVLQQLRQTVAQLQQQLHMLQDQILGRQQQQQQAAAGKHRSSDLGGVICADFVDQHAEGPLTQALSRGVSPTGELVLHEPQQQQGAVPPNLAQESQQLRLQLMVKQHTISKLQKQLAEVTSSQTAPLSPPGPAPTQTTQISNPSNPNLGQALTSDRTRSRSDRTRSGSQSAESAALASLRQHAAMLEGVLLEVQAESAAKDEIMQELTQQAELRVGAGYARTEELRRLYRDMASKDAYISRLESRVRAMTSRTPSPTQPPQHEQQQMPTAHKLQQQQPQRAAAKDRGEVAGLPVESNLVPKRSYVQLQAQLQAANTGQQHQRAAAGRAGNRSSTATAAAAATLKQRAAARLQGNGQAAAVAPEASSEGGAHPTVGMYADTAEAMHAAAGVAGQACSAGSSNSDSNNGSLSARQRLTAAASRESIISGQAAAVAAVGAAAAMSKVLPRLQRQGWSSSSSAEAGSCRSLTGATWQQRQQPGVVVDSSNSSSSRAESNSAGKVSATNPRVDSIGNPISNRASPQITSLGPNPAGNPIYTLDSHSNPQMWVSNTLYSPRTTAESARSHQSDNSSGGSRVGNGGSAVMRAAMQQLQQLRLQRQSQQLEGVRRSIQEYPLQQQRQHSAEWE